MYLRPYTHNIEYPYLIMYGQLIIKFIKSAENYTYRICFLISMIAKFCELPYVKTLVEYKIVVYNHQYQYFTICKR